MSQSNANRGGGGKSNTYRGNPASANDADIDIFDQARINRENRMREYSANPTYNPGTYRGNQRGSPSYRGYQRNRQNNFMQKQNTKTMNTFNAQVSKNLQGEFVNLESSMAQISIPMSDVDIPLPMSTRNIGFVLCNLLTKVDQVPDVAKRMPRTTPYEIYRVLLALNAQSVYENQKNLKSINTTLILQFSRATIEFFQFIINMSVLPMGFAGIQKLFQPLTHYEVRTVPVYAADSLAIGGEIQPVAETVNFQNLNAVVTELAKGGAGAQMFKERNPLPGAKWGADSKLLNPTDFWPVGYNPDQFHNELTDVREYFLTLSTLRERWMTKFKADQGSMGCYVSSMETSLKIADDRVTGQCSDFYSTEKLKPLEANEGLYGLVGEYPSFGKVNALWSRRKKECACLYINSTYAQARNNIE